MLDKNFQDSLAFQVNSKHVLSTTLHVTVVVPISMGQSVIHFAFLNNSAVLSINLKAKSASSIACVALGCSAD